MKITDICFWLLIFVVCFLSFLVILFVCVDVLRPSQPNGVMLSMVSLPSHTFTGQAYSSKRLTSIVHILLPESNNCPSWISGRERMAIENISWSISTKECCRLGRGWARDLLVSSRTAHPTEPPKPAHFWWTTERAAKIFCICYSIRDWPSGSYLFVVCFVVSF